MNNSRNFQLAHHQAHRHGIIIRSVFLYVMRHALTVLREDPNEPVVDRLPSIVHAWFYDPGVEHAFGERLDIEEPIDRLQCKTSRFARWGGGRGVLTS